MSSVTEVEYRAIEGYPFYRATSEGFIQSCRVRTRGNLVSSVWRTLRGANGYRRPKVCMSNEHGERSFIVSRVICTAFHGPCPDGMECCHNDGNSENNVPSNLRWDTPVGNMADKKLHGTELVGSKNHFAKLTDSDVIRIREMCAAGMNRREVGEAFGVHRNYVTEIFKRRTWSHI